MQDESWFAFFYFFSIFSIFYVCQECVGVSLSSLSVPWPEQPPSTVQWLIWVLGWSVYVVEVTYSNHVDFSLTPPGTIIAQSLLLKQRNHWMIYWYVCRLMTMMLFDFCHSARCADVIQAWPLPRSFHFRFCLLTFLVAHNSKHTNSC